PLSPQAHEIEKVPLSSLKVRSISRFGGDIALAGRSADSPGDSSDSDSMFQAYDSSLSLAMGRFEYLKTHPAGEHVVFGLGAHVGLGQAVGHRCSEDAVCVDGVCECPGEQARWRGISGKYGVTAG